MTRVYGTLKPLNPNLLGGYLAACVPVLLGLCATSRGNLLIWSAPALLTVTALFATGCRGAYLAFGSILICVFIILAKHLPKKIFLSLAAAALTAITYGILSVSSLRARVLSMFAMRQDSSNSFRFNVYQSSIEMFKDNWLLGIGCGNKNFREIYGLYMKTGFDALSTYNVFLEIAVESGIFALIAFLGFLTCTIKNALCFKDEIFILTAMVSITAVMVHGLVDTVFFRPQIQFIFWTMAAIINSRPKIPLVSSNLVLGAGGGIESL
jgi:putative inorganic carbon (HCO3(-)) transporter